MRCGILQTAHGIWQIFPRKIVVPKIIAFKITPRVGVANWGYRPSSHPSLIFSVFSSLTCPVFISYNLRLTLTLTITIAST